jgi:two-component system, OmpR family, response regulator
MVIVMSHKVLVVEDDSTLLGVIKYNLVKEGYTAITAGDGVQAIESARKEHPDIIILDIMLPKMDGLDVCRIIRTDMTVPIIMLTAKSEEIDKVVGLEIGADDYMTKPFSMKELMARIKALLRRAEMVGQKSGYSTTADLSVIKAGEFEVDVERHTASHRGADIELTPKEFDLLVCLMRNRGRVMSRDNLLEKVWGYDFDGDSRTVDVHIRWLRGKIEDDAAQPRHLITVRGVGYKFQE